MNREQAIKAVSDKIGLSLSGPFIGNMVDAMAALGVLKLDEPAQHNIRLPVACPSSDGPDGIGYVDVPWSWPCTTPGTPVREKS